MGGVLAASDFSSAASSVDSASDIAGMDRLNSDPDAAGKDFDFRDRGLWTRDSRCIM